MSTADRPSSASAWFLSAVERGNPDTTVGRDEPWTEGNAVALLIHGSTYFSRLIEVLSTLGVGDRVLIADWRGDADERLRDMGPTLGELLRDLAHRGVDIRGLLWRSHPDAAGFNEEEDSALAATVNEAGGKIMLDERVRRGGSHHQKLVLVSRRDRPGEDIAFVGGIDLCHGRRDDDRHGGDPQAEKLDPAFGERPPWHDIQTEVRGPAVAQLFETFRERWNDPTPLERKVSPLRRVRFKAAKEPEELSRLPEYGRIPEPAGSQTIQVLRTYPVKRPGYPFASQGERSIARMYAKTFERARSLLYVEDQYFWAEGIAPLYERALQRAPELRVVVVVPRHPDRNGAVSGPANRVGQLDLMERLQHAGGDRVLVTDLENEAGDAIYVHAKTVIVDDVFAVVGSDNMNRRSWTHDSELSLAVLDEERDEREPRDPAGLGDGARRFARELRLRLWREHLATGADDGLLDPAEAFERWRSSAAALDAWHEGGRKGPRPPGRLRVHRPRPVPAWQRVWARPIYRAVVDPDGRPGSLRRSGSF